MTEDRKFANDPVTSVPATPAPTMIATPIATDPPVVTASPETLLSSRGTPGTLYTLHDGRLLAIAVDEDGSAIEEILDPGEASVLDYASAPSGDRVAVLLSPADGSVALRILASDGEMLLDDTVVFPDGATPVADNAAAGSQVHWSPQGDAVVVIHDRSLAAVQADGTVEIIDLDGLEGSLVDARPSPDGSRLLLQMKEEDGANAVYIHSFSDGRNREVTAVSTTAQYGIANMQWLPDGSGIVYMRGSIVQGIPMRGQLYRYILGQEVPTLLATSGQGGPSATITDASVSPDGRKVVYVISVLDGNRWAYHSMWVRSLEVSLNFSVPVGRAGVVVDPAWVDGGIAWEQRPSQDAPGTLRFIGSGEEIVILHDSASIPAGTPVGTPGATPVGTPGATPVGTPGATPLSDRG